MDNSSVLLRAERDYEFASAKTLQGQVDITPDGAIAVVSRGGSDLKSEISDLRFLAATT